MIDGTYRILSIKLNGVFLPVGLLNSNSFSETSEMLDTTTSDNGGWKTSVPTNQSFSIDFDGLIKQTTSVFQIETVLTYNDIRNLKRNRSLIEWKIDSSEDIYVSTGFGHITSLGDSSSIEEFVSFNANIEGYGQIIETTKKVGNPIIIFVQSDNLGTSNDNQFTITTNPSLSYDYLIQTSDGQVISSVNGDYTITFNTLGTHDIYITGTFPSFYYNNASDKEKITKLKNFGFYANAITQVKSFYGCTNMVITSTDLGDFSSVINFTETWRNCSSLTSFPLINTGSATNFTETWDSCSSLTSFPSINTSIATNFTAAWNNCSSLTSFPLLNTSSGIGFTFAWRNCSSLTSFPLINTSSGTNFTQTWVGCSSLTSFPLLNTGSVTNFTETWNGCSSLASFPLINTGSATNFNATWNNCLSLTSFPLINTSSVTNFTFAWRNCSSLASFALINTGSATNFNYSWKNCSSLTSFPLINTSSGTNFTATWNDCSSLTSFPLINTSSGADFTFAWKNCSSLTSFPLLNTSSATDFTETWDGCSSLASFPSNFFDNCLAINFTNSFKNTNLSQTSIDNILISINSNSTSNGIFSQTGGSNTPSATGVSAKNSMISRGWTVTTN
jgi:hypothetical protein